MLNSKSRTLSLKEQLDQFDAEVDAQSQELWGDVSRNQVSLLNSPKFKNIISILLDQPILVAPTLNWLLEKRAALARKQLEALYTPEQLEIMYAEAEKS